ncbi:ribosomal protein S18-alanine N-acetyltransferase [Conchiformibius kuhniae]|uniref:[Ribosomal protein bS18]-alanine N-acetyltransferase n=1 Tax=Conchiformibius kuhniae TaxID=211502 RepID=A0A8T9MWF0_9NEIS|nr:ribosomal protein S18-alanine N-acetyltransferase [Conchiformibius kuhniae]UOP05579.1 ribosomal protein S18-alanine N-acetyltransferase [Conchiformibius kuhniae]
MMLRPARETDLPALAALDARCNPSAWTLRQFQAACAAPHDRILLIERDGAPAAFAVWQCVCGEAELHLIATAPEYRRQGLAARLLAAVADDVAQCGGERILLEVRAGNVAAQALYRAHGFTELAVRPRYYQDGEDAVLMFQLTGTDKLSP